MKYKTIKRKCGECKKIFEFPPSQLKQKRRFCSRKCLFDYLRTREFPFKGEKHWCWKGGKTKNTRGYVLVKSYNHPFANKNNSVREHRLVMEKHLGRYLLPKERVHHINKDKADNRIKNLKLFGCAGDHIKHHFKIKKEEEDGK